MLEFITKNFNFISYFFEFLAMLTGLLCLKKYKGTTTTFFILFLIYIVLIDFTGATFFYDNNFKLTTYLRSIGFNSMSWYNLFWIFGTVLLILYYIYSVLRNNFNRRFILVLGGVYFVLMLSHFYIYPNVFFKAHDSYYQFTGAFTLLIGCSVYFIELINSETISNALKTYSFYALSAILIWWLIVTPILFFEAYNTVVDFDFVYLKRRIFVFANIFMYSCFAIGLIISKPQPHYV